MKKWWKESALRQQENGMEAIEGLLVITLMLFCAVLYLGVWFLMYQNWAVQYVATGYSIPYCADVWYSSSDPITGYISHATRVSLSPYRYKDDEEEKIQDVNANRAEKYARYSLKKAGFAKEKGLDIEVTTVKDVTCSKPRGGQSNCTV